MRHTAFPNGDELLYMIREFVVPGPDLDTPAALGIRNATASAVGLSFATVSEAGATGGGIAVGNDGRTNIVGSSWPQGPSPAPPSSYPVFNTGGRPGDAGIDAVRTELDLLPPALVGTARTDGTGVQNATAVYPGQSNGGTTPACALSAFGARIGAPAPTLERMLIDYQGATPASGVSDAAILSPALWRSLARSLCRRCRLASLLRSPG